MSADYKRTFSAVKAPSELSVESVRAHKRKTYSNRSLAASIAAVFLLTMVLTNTISYAATGETWVKALWDRIEPHELEDGTRMWGWSYEGDGYKIVVEHGYNPTNQNDSVFVGESEGVEVKEIDGKILLMFGENIIDLTDGMERAAKSKQMYGVQGRIRLGDREVICEITDVRNWEDAQIDFGVAFFDAEAVDRANANHAGMYNILLRRIKFNGEWVYEAK